MRLTEIIRVNGKEYVNIKGTKGIYVNAERKGAPASNAIVRLAAYEDTGLTPEDILCIRATQRITPERLAEIVRAEFEERLVILPCKVGDTVYKLWYAPCHNGETYPDGIGCDGCIDQCDIHKEITEFTVPNVNFIWVNFVMKGNTTYYLTREEAEAALKGESEDV